MPSSDLPLSGPGEISWGKVKQCPAASALNTPRPRPEIGRRVGQHACPGARSLRKDSLAFGAAVRLRLPSHTPSRERLRLSIVQAPSRAAAFTSRLPPIGPAGDFHPQSLHHAQRTAFGYASSNFSAPAAQRIYPNRTLIAGGTGFGGRPLRPSAVGTPYNTIRVTIYRAGCQIILRKLLAILRPMARPPSMNDASRFNGAKGATEQAIAPRWKLFACRAHDGASSPRFGWGKTSGSLTRSRPRASRC